MRYEIELKEGGVIMFDTLRAVFDYAVERHFGRVDIYVVTGVGGLKGIDDWIKSDVKVKSDPNM